jgi:Tfp pilus assembly protein PilF
MTEDEYLDKEESENDIYLQGLVAQCDSAYRDGSLETLVFSEEEFDILINYYIEEMEEGVAYSLSKMGYEQHPYSGDLTIRYADALIISGETDEAIELLNKQLNYDSCDSDIYLLLARSYVRKREDEDVFFYTKKAVFFNTEENPEFFWISVAQEYLEQDDYDNALKCYKNAESLAPDNEDLLNDLAYTYERAGLPNESILYYRKYIDRDAFNDNVWSNLGTIYAREDEHDKAIEAFNYAYALNSSNSSALYNKGILLVNIDRFSDAQEVFDDFIQLEPDSYLSFIAIAEAFILKDQYDQALIYIRIVIDKFTGDYEHLSELLHTAYLKTTNPEIQLYYIASLYRTNNLCSIDENIDILMSHNSTIWLDKLLVLIPDLKHNERILHYIEK